MLRSLHECPARLFGTVFVGFLALSFVVAVGPAIEVQAKYPPTARQFTAEERRGLQVYLSEGCAACHTQQVRSGSVDAAWGRPTRAQDYAHLKPLAWWQGTPSTPGSARTGPDLSDIGTRQPSVEWQLIHLYNPRAVSPGSIMPAFPWLFEELEQPPANARVVAVPRAFRKGNGSRTIVARREALDLVAYLASLRQPAARGASTPAKASEPSSSEGAELYVTHCAACHQADGEGVAGTFPPLRGDPVVNDADPTRHIEVVLRGMRGKEIGGVEYPVAMPPFADLLSDAQVAALVNHERGSWGNRGSPVTVEQVAQVRASGGQP